MRFNGLALVVSAVVLAACAGGDNQEAATTDTAAAAAAAPSAAGSVASAPATGTTHEVKMVLTPQGGYEFQPKDITINAGDAIKWVMVSGGPHNVAFEAANMAEAARAQLSANMPDQQGELTSPMMINADESYTVSFANVAPGTYNYVCTPHIAMGMTGTVTVK
jgi:plastocyanin